MKKRGELLNFTVEEIQGLILVAFVIFSLFYITDRIRSSKSYEMTFLAKDLSLVVSTLYAAPGEAKLNYDRDTLDLSYKFSPNEISVVDTKGPSTFGPEDADLHDHRTASVVQSTIPITPSVFLTPTIYEDRRFGPEDRVKIYLQKQKESFIIENTFYQLGGAIREDQAPEPKPTGETVVT